MLNKYDPEGMRFEFPSLKGFDFGLDAEAERDRKIADAEFPSLKGFDFGLDV